MSTPKCPDCNSRMTPRYARRGPNAGNHFWGCIKYPDCTGTRQMTAPDCPKCGGDMVPRFAKYGSNAGNHFWGCKKYTSTGCSGIVNM